MDFEIKRELFRIAQEFKSNSFSLKTVTQIVNVVREYRHELSVNDVRTLLNIPLNILRYDVQLVNEKTWSNGRSNYFYGNMVCEDEQSQDKFLMKWRDKFKSKSFDLLDMIEYLETIIANFERYKNESEFYLRNIEVTIRDDLKLNNYSDFKNCGELFYSEIIRLTQK